METNNAHYLILSKISSQVDTKISPNSLVSTFHNFKKNFQKNYMQIYTQLTQLNITEKSCSPIISFKKEPIKRTYQDIYNIKRFLDSSDFGKKFKDKSIPQDSVNKMLIICAVEMKYHSIQPREILFRIGDPGKDFYLILSGQVDVLKPELKQASMTGFEYFTHLMNLKKENEKYVYNKTIKENIQSFYIDDIDKDIINHITFINFLIEITERKKFVSIDYIVDLCLINLAIIPKLNLTALEEQQGNIESITIIKDYFTLTDMNLLRRYDYFLNDFEKKELIIYEYKSLVTLQSSCDFGDSALDKKIERNSTIQSIGQTEFAVLEGVIYCQMISKEKFLLTNKEVNFLHKNFFLSEMPYKAFDRKYFSFFVLEEKVKGDYLCQEDDQVNKIIFVKKGTVGLFTNKSILETHLLLTKMQNKKPEIKDNNSYFPVKNNLNDLKKQLNEKKVRRIFNYDSNEIIGLESFVFDFPHLVSAIITSENATVFKIDIRHFKQICLEPRVKDNLKAFSTEKLGILYQRLYEMNKILIKKIDEKRFYSNTSNKGKVIIRKRNSTFTTNLNSTSYNNDKGILLDVDSLNKQKTLKNNSKSHASRSSILPKLKDSNDLNKLKKTSFGGLTYECLFLNKMKRDIKEESKIVISMKQDVIKLSSSYKINGINFLLKSSRSCNNITNKSFNLKKLNPLLQPRDYSKKNILITQMHNQYSVELNLNKEMNNTIVSANQKRFMNPYINPSVQEKKNKYAVFNQYQKNISLSPSKYSNGEGCYLFPKGKVLSKSTMQKALEYHIHKKSIDLKINSSLKYDI